MPVSVFTVTAADVTYEFPPATLYDFIMPFCVIGASDASGSSNINTLSYTALPVGNFDNGLTLFDDRPYTLSGADNTICTGGIYLRPSKMRVRETSFKSLPRHNFNANLFVFLSSATFNLMNDSYF